MSKKLLCLTQVITKPSEEGQKRIDAALERRKNGGEKTNEDGYTAEWFRDMNLPVPEDLLESEEDDDIDEEGYMFIPNEELEYVFLDMILSLDDFSSATKNEDIGSTVITKEGVSYHVQEEVEDIFGIIYITTQTWKERVIENWKYKIKNIFKKKEKDLIL